VTAKVRATRAVVAQDERNTTTLSAEAYKALQAKQTTEAQFQRALVKTAADYGWLAYHTRFSVGSDPGFPDLVLLRGAECVIAELKRVGKDPTAKQFAWLDAWGRVPGVRAYVWRPDCWDEIHDVLGKDWPIRQEAQP
jgi:hypothetical protein